MHQSQLNQFRRRLPMAQLIASGLTQRIVIHPSNIFVIEATNRFVIDVTTSLRSSGRIIPCAPKSLYIVFEDVTE